MEETFRYDEKKVTRFYLENVKSSRELIQFKIDSSLVKSDPVRFLERAIHKNIKEILMIYVGEVEFKKSGLILGKEKILSDSQEYLYLKSFLTENTRFNIKNLEKVIKMHNKLIDEIDSQSRIKEDPTISETPENE